MRPSNIRLFARRLARAVVYLPRSGWRRPGAASAIHALFSGLSRSGFGRFPRLAPRSCARATGRPNLFYTFFGLCLACRLLVPRRKISLADPQSRRGRAGGLPRLACSPAGVALFLVVPFAPTGAAGSGWGPSPGGVAGRLARGVRRARFARGCPVSNLVSNPKHLCFTGPPLSRANNGRFQ